MNGPDECAGISDILPEFLAGRVSADDDRRIRQHLKTCAECRSRANAVSLLQQTPVPQPDPDGAAIESEAEPVDLCAKVLKSFATFSPWHSGQEMLSPVDLTNSSKILSQFLHVYSKMGI